MWQEQILLGVIGFSAGVAVAAGLFSFIIELGVVADFADRTRTADKILLYEDSAALGGMLGNLIFCFQIRIPGGEWLLPAAGGLAGIFVGCWSMALAEILNVFPVFLRRINLVKYTGYFILGTAIGKGVGAYLFFMRGW